jgi:menaquinone-specific isochorismate synthase
VIPEVVLGRQDGHTFVTRMAGATAVRDPTPVTVPGPVTWSDEDSSTVDFTAAVTAAIARIKAGDASKVVLAHALSAHADVDVDERYLLARLAESYPSCTAFAVEGLLGASPETLIRRAGPHVSSRVLAGTAWPLSAADGRVEGQQQVAKHLLASAKDLAEHRFAVDSVAGALRGVTSYLEVPDAPSALELTNLTHLATDIRGELDGLGESAPTALELAARLHPTAAVGGTPTDAARAMIRDLEPRPRGRYGAPVGWIDARGDGEFAIALRCAQVSGPAVRLMAGCGIVADSDPATEAREAQVKMIPVRDALR